MSKIIHFQIGKKGLTNNFIETLKKTFEKNNIVKIAFLKSSGRTHDSIERDAEEILEKLGKNYIAKRIGLTLVLRKFRKPVR